MGLQSDGSSTKEATDISFENWAAKMQLVKKHFFIGSY